MTPDDARAALDDIRMRHEQSRAEEARHNSGPFYLGIVALIVLLSFASFDMPNPWSGAMLFPVAALAAVLVLVHGRRAPVRRTPDSRELLLGVAGGIALAAGLQGLASAGQAAGVPTPHLVSAAIGAVLCVLVASRPRWSAAARRH
ncbi:hypothetical protein AB0J74_18200 [Asanoa sp. NPDC049573]|uniref:hypothetical protein n=1 Tax=Asanoa sp. NPDC049573 TaxID=3155396 RepID=UPI00343CB57A